MNLTLSEEEVARLNEFNTFSKSVGAISPTDTHQLFYFDATGKKLEVYAPVQGGQVQVSLDVDSQDSTDIYWLTDVSDFLTKCNKIGGKVTLSTDGTNKKITFKGAGRGYMTSNPFGERSESEIKEIRTAYAKVESIADTEKTVLNIDEKKLHLFSLAAAAIKQMKNTNYIGWTKNEIRSSDYINTLNMTCDDTAPEDLYIYGPLIPLLTGVKALTLFNDGKRGYFADESGVKVIMTFPDPEYSYPEDDALKSYLPSGNKLVINLKTADLFEALSKFDGTFADWQYGQIRMKVSLAADGKTGELHLQFDDMSSSVEWTTPFTVVSGLTTPEDITFTLPTVNISGALKELFTTKDTLEMEMSAEGRSVKFNFDNAWVAISKMNEA